ncbi:acyltransferase family protein [Spirosoma oryzicola]|uniref:acyltransferase family protein n=1 Tax=Spirosoma oryzicola TaxID=2898794 RepID=UPI001E351765|nr:acyltransferase [Spirosoma oryzicola]UHG92453.1 acyltransferase [Spirosoma oryzicola]
MMLSDPTKTTPTTYHLPALTGLRAGAAYLVFLHHYNPVSGTEPTGWWHRLFDQGYIGVSIFFTLSGFLIYHRYAEPYFNSEKWSWKTYYQNRFARTIPLYGLIFLVTVGVTIAQGRPTHWFDLLLNLTLLKGFFDDYKFSGIAQSWSLTVELCFYLAAPFLFSALRRWGPLKLTFLLLSTGMLLYLTIGSLNWHGLFGNLPFMLFYTFPGRSFEFVAGMWAAQQWQGGQLLHACYLTAKSLLLLAFCVISQTCITGWTTNTSVLTWSEVISYNFILPISLAFLLLGLLREQSGLQRLLAYPIVQTLGRSSYAFYLIHIGVVSKFIGHVLPGIGIGPLFVVLVLVSQGLYRWVEKPLQQRFRSRNESVTNPSIP